MKKNIYVVYAKMLSKASSRCYIGKPINENWMNVVELDQAEKFATREEAKNFIKTNDLAGVDIKEVEIDQ